MGAEGNPERRLGHGEREVGRRLVWSTSIDCDRANFSERYPTSFCYGVPLSVGSLPTASARSASFTGSFRKAHRAEMARPLLPMSSVA